MSTKGEEIRRRWIGLGTILMMIIGGMLFLTACGGGDSEQDTENAEETTMQTTQEEPAVSEDTWKNAYREVLEENEYSIRSYETGVYGDGAERANALCDLNHDGVPELLFFAWTEENIRAELNIYTCQEKGAKKLQYTFPETIPGTGDADSGEEPYYDVFAAGGTKYIVYTEKDSNRFAIYSTITDENIVVKMARYEMDEYCDISETADLGYDFMFVIMDGDNYVGTTDTVDLEEAEMYIDGTEVTKTDYLKAYEASRDAMDQVIFCSKEGARGDDETIWKKAEKIGACAVSYDDMMTELEVDSTDK